VLLAARGGCPVVAAPRRIEAARLLLGRYGCDVIVSDDGLQHYALGRDIEIAVINGMRRYGNGFCLPAGPLREPKGRLAQVDLRVCNAGTPGPGELAMQVRPGELRNLGREGQSRTLPSFAGEKVHAVAGIAHPQRFFSLLSEAGLDIIPHAFPDHYPFRLADIEFPDELPVLMTEKDAVKCRRFANLRYWYLPLEVYPDPALGEALLTLLRRRVHGQEAA
jgi:tetraacyldisaccharide 4'-kinase